ncbi:DUF2071 domain-containing protein [Prosthecobacter sp.]|uniref:DUF2071 domain-containing protein n=1 Tax=Prosthecobacter sp. TaxID=1965333 RepID=UPI001D36C59F|nr:DUF2071 domain-containing protein [Prosthecobacter sp.]MCB1277280.1 DUF2071 domain-containing protein [Prosthecobacter sp.]
MKLETPSRLHSWQPSAAGRERLLACRGDPLFYADWLDAVFLHFETDPVVLQREVPWPLDLFEGRAFVSLVAFTMRDLRPRLGGRLAALPFKPIATHEFLNVRVYVKHGGEPGIHFLAEWVPNALSVALGPVVFGLPYRLGTLRYDHGLHSSSVNGCVEDARSGKAFAYTCTADADTVHRPCEAGSLDEFLVERYTAFTSVGLPGFGPKRLLRRFFRIWHPPWPLIPLRAEIEDLGLLSLTGNWSRHARLVSAHHSPGVENVCMSRPHLLLGGNAA